MPKPLDATMRKLYELGPAAWLEYFGLPIPDPAQVRVIDSNLSTVTAEADQVVLVGGADPWIVHTEFLSGREANYPQQAIWYNILLQHRHQVPIWTVLILLRPQADGPELTGVYESEVPGCGKNHWFRYEVIRVWLEPPERLLRSGLPLLPLGAGVQRGCRRAARGVDGSGRPAASRGRTRVAADVVDGDSDLDGLALPARAS